MHIHISLDSTQTVPNAITAVNYKQKPNVASTSLRITQYYILLFVCEKSLKNILLRVEWHQFELVDLITGLENK
jgi:hypothetical protein